MRFTSILTLALILSLASGTWIASAPAAAQPSVATLAAATPVFFQQGAAQQFAAPPPVTGPPPRGSVGTSVIPPGAPPSSLCSINLPALECSAFQINERCSALNNQNHLCSTFEMGPPAERMTCSAWNVNAVCSVLPTQNPPVSPSGCSSAPQIGGALHQCSAVGPASRQLCSAKGAGDSGCSAFRGQAGPSQCSVLNTGAADRSFCSTKFNQPTLAKLCSTLESDAGSNAACSVIQGGRGVCTAFGAADMNSCSAFVAATHCSVIGGAAGNPCAQ